MSAKIMMKTSLGPAVAKEIVVGEWEIQNPWGGYRYRAGTREEIARYMRTVIAYNEGEDSPNLLPDELKNAG